MNDQLMNQKGIECSKRDPIKHDDMVAKINANNTYQTKVVFMPLGEIKEWFRAHGLSDQIKLEPKVMMITLKLMGVWDE